MSAEWLLKDDELELLKGRSDDKRLGFALLLKHFQKEYRFPAKVGFSNCL